MGNMFFRTCSLVSLSLAIFGCGDDASSGGQPDAPSRPPPRIIGGGGIGDGPIDGVANIYVIAADTRAPIAGATVRVGEVEGTTDDTGLFIADGVTGPQTVAVKAASMRSEVWVGANGTNMTFAMEPSTDPAPARATLSGRVDTTGVSVTNGHTVVAVVYYSQTEDLGDPANEIESNGNICLTGPNNDQPCNYSIDVRTGTISLLAAIFDRDLNNTPLNPNDDTQVLVRWAVKSNIAVVAGVPQSNVDLTLISTIDQHNVTVDFQSPPSGHTQIAGLIGLELGADHVMQIPQFVVPQAPTRLLPKPAAIGASGYRLTGLSANGTAATSATSIVLRRSLGAGQTLAAGTWLAPPTAATATRTAASWTAAPSATLHTVEYTDSTETTAYLNITVLDGTTSVTVPDLVALPATGALRASVNALGATGLDVTNFSLDADEDKLVQLANQPIAIP